MKRRNFIKGGIGLPMFLAPGLSAASSYFKDDENEGSGRRGKESYLRLVDRVIAGGPFQDTWESLAAYTAPQWYQDAKFGIFIHWGVYSVPAQWSEWYPREMYRTNNLPVWLYHRIKWGPQHKFGYKDFIPMFRAEEFDPEAWAGLFQKAGARYVVPVAEHHDGFAMYDCGFSPWNAVKMGPRRDVIGELARAVRGKNLWFGLSSHRAAHWWFMNGGRRFKSDVSDPRYQSLYGPAQPEDIEPDQAFMEDWLARSAELVDLYRPHIFWFDFGIGRTSFEPFRRKLAAYYYNRADQWGEEVVLNYKNDAFPEGSAVLDFERAGVSEIRPLVWQTDTSVSFVSWGYIDAPYQRFKSAGRLIHDLVDTVSKNGVLLLNVGPRPDGLIPEQEKDILLDIGGWLEINGEAIYGSRPWKVFGEGPTNPRENNLFGLGEMMAPKLTARDVRFTRKGGAIYALVMGWPQSRRVSIGSLGKNSGLIRGRISSVRLLGHQGPGLEWTQDDHSLKVTLPPERPCEHALALEVRGLEDENT